MNFNNENKRTVAVLEMTLKQKIKLNEEKDFDAVEHIDKIGLNHNQQEILEFLCKFINSALLINNKKFLKN